MCLPATQHLCPLLAQTTMKAEAETQCQASHHKSLQLQLDGMSQAICGLFGCKAHEYCQIEMAWRVTVVKSTDHHLNWARWRPNNLCQISPCRANDQHSDSLMQAWRPRWRRQVVSRMRTKLKGAWENRLRSQDADRERR